jgi:hypothetical protein
MSRAISFRKTRLPRIVQLKDAMREGVDFIKPAEGDGDKNWENWLFYLRNLPKLF